MNLCALLRVTGRDTLRRLLTHREYLDWVRFWNWAPWGGDRDDMRAVYLASAAVAPHTKSQRMPRVKEFLFAFGRGEPVKRMKEEDMKAIVKSAPGWVHTPPPEVTSDGK
jgi:hypothetical protein